MERKHAGRVRAAASGEPFVGYDRRSVEGLFLAGDADAYACVSRWIGRILTLPRFRVVRRDWTDLHQEILRRIVDSLRNRRFDPTLDFRAYVQSTARYTARDAVERRLRELPAPLPSDLRYDGTGAEARIVTREAVEFVLARLSSQCRTLFRLFYYEERSQAEMSEILRIPVGTVKSRLFRCLERGRGQIMAPQQD